MKIRTIAILFSPWLILAGCSREPSEQPAPKPEQKVEQPAAPAAVAKPLYDPEHATAKAPDAFKVRFETTRGDVVLDITRGWAPLGVDRFYNLVKIGYFDDTAFFRVLPGFMAQFGINGNPEANRIWKNSQIPDYAVKESNRRGTISFATAGPNTRTTQLFINYGDNSQLDGMGFAPIGKVSEGMAVIDSLYSGYGEGAPEGKGPNQGFLQARGNPYLRDFFPKLDYIKKATIVE